MTKREAEVKFKTQVTKVITELEKQMETEEDQKSFKFMKYRAENLKRWRRKQSLGVNHD